MPSKNLWQTRSIFTLLTSSHMSWPTAATAHSSELCGRALTPSVIPLHLCSVTPILGHRLHRLPDLRVTHEHSSPTDSHKPHHHCRFSRRHDIRSAAWRWQGLYRIRLRLSPLPG